jgi:hypothetical protein
VSALSPLPRFVAVPARVLLVERCRLDWIGLDREVVIWREGGERDGFSVPG